MNKDYQVPTQIFRLVGIGIHVLFIVGIVQILLFCALTVLFEYKTIAFFFQLFLNFVVIHYVTGNVIFILQLSIYRQIMAFNDGCNHAEDISRALSDLIIALKDLDEVKTIIVKNPFPDITDTYLFIKQYLGIFGKIKKKFGLSPNQDNLYRALNAFCLTYKEFDFKHYVERKKSENPIFKLGMKKLEADALIIKEIVDDFRCEEYEWYSYKFIRTMMYNDCLGSFNQLKIKFENNFSPKYYSLRTPDNNIIEYAILKTLHLGEDSKPNLLIYCIPNGMAFQSFAPSRLSMYLYKNVDILFWNYRGYGASTGHSTFRNVKNDVISLYDEVVGRNRSDWDMIGVHGYSIGGIAAAHLARYRQVDLLVSDRNFSNIEYIAKSYQTFGYIAFILYKLLCMNSTYTIENYMNVLNKKCYKILLCDPDDSIINNNGSVKSGISRYIIKNHLVGNEKKINNILDALLDSTKKNELIESLLFLCDIYYKDELYEKDALFLQERYSNEKFFIIDEIRSNMRMFFGAFREATEDLASVVEIKSKRVQRLFLETFFNNLSIWGCQSKDKKEYECYSPTNNTRVIDKALGYLYKILSNNTIKIIIQKGETLEAIKRIQLIHTHFNFLKEKMNAMTFNSTEFDKGNLVKISCGHNGMLDSNEHEVFLNHLFKSGFVIY